MTAPEQIGDNVGCFLSLAGYNVIVPGKLDFYFGAERLRRIAQRLESVPEPAQPGDNTFRPVHMLAVNLVQRTTFWKEPAKIPDSEKRRLEFIPGLPQGLQAVEITDHGSILPFLQTVSFKGEKNFVFEPYLCQASAEDDLDEILPCPTKQRIVLKQVACDPEKDPLACPEKKAGDATAESAEKVPLKYALGKLEAEANYGLCIDGDSPTDKPHCIRFSVARPYLLSALGPDCPNTTEACHDWAKPYYFKKWPDGRQVVMFGVVDPDLPSLVGRDNLSWRNSDPRLQTSLAVLDPVKAVQQAMQYFEEAEKGNIDESKLRKVLLAQMTRAKAEELASHLDFDVVIAGAADRNHATGSAKLTLDPEPPSENSQARSYRTVVAVPERALDSGRHLIDPLREVTMKDFDAFAPDGGARRELAMKSYWDPVNAVSADTPMKQFSDPLDRVADAWLAGQGGGKSARGKPGSLFVTATLKIMRDKTNADVAMVQKRDFYWGNLRSSEYMGENIASVLWKGDVLQVIAVTGDTLKKVLRESKQFDQADIQPTKGHDESGRGLLLFGIEETEDGNYLIGGSLIDKNRLYTVATTSHISAGDTGYPELNDPALARRALPESAMEGLSVSSGEEEESGRAVGTQISRLACVEMRKQLEEQYPGKTAGCVGEDSKSLFALSDQRTAQSKPDSWSRVIAWGKSSMDRPILAKKENPKAPPSPEDREQNRPTWRVSMDELSWNFSSVRNNLSEVQRVTQLTGASDPAAYAAKGHSIDYATRAEWVRSTSSVDEFVRGQLLYKESSTGSTKTISPGNLVVPSLPNVSRSKNDALLDAGFFWHGIGHNKFFPQSGLVIEPFHFDTQLFESALAINSHYNSSGALDRGAFTVPLERTRMFLGRLGYRVQNKNYSFEAGYEGGWEANALEKLIFQVGNSMAECDLNSKQTLTTCLSGQPISIKPGTIHQVRGTRGRNGFYASMDWTLPLMRKMSFVAQGGGEYFFEGPLDNSSDTLYRNLMSGTIRIPILPNLSIAPGLERLDYENKLNHTHLATWSPIFKLVYSFDEYSGGSWIRAVSFKP